MPTLTPLRAILCGTLTVAILDGSYAVIVLSLRGVPASRVFQGIAAGLLGRDAFSGGLATVGLGLALHVLIAFAVVSTYVAVSNRLPVLRVQPFVFGPIYGLLVYMVMNLVVIPLSAAGGGSRSSWAVLGGLAIHVVGVGLPAAYFAAALRPAPQPTAPSLPRASASA